MSKTHCVQILLISILVLTFAGTASADPTLSITVNDELQFSALLRSGSVTETRDFEIPTMPAVGEPFWVITVQGTLTERNPDDSVSLTVIVQHVRSPSGHGDGAGPQMLINLNLVPMLAFGNLGEFEVTQVLTVVHGPHNHEDVLTAVLNARLSRSAQGDPIDIIGWTVRVDAQHVPEPATMALLGMGLAGVAMKIRRSRRSKKIS